MDLLGTGPVTEQAPIVLQVSRWDVLKDPHGVIQGFADHVPDSTGTRVHLVSLPMEDPAENATLVNALQRYATVIAQKSLAEGFGLTVAEAMWKGRPAIASRIGGIETQILDGETVLLLDDPRDLKAFGAAGYLAVMKRLLVRPGARAAA